MERVSWNPGMERVSRNRGQEEGFLESRTGRGF